MSLATKIDRRRTARGALSTATVAACLLLTAIVPLLAATPAAAQAPGFTLGDWKRVETEHFLFLYPSELSEWALDMASRMEAVHGAVAGMVGFAPEDRVTVVVDDPGNVSNGSMWPGPLLYMWPTPPNPRSMIGENRGWGEILAVHEFAHAAHLTRPSRNPTQRRLLSLLPLPLTNIMRTTPRWATEGYATYIEDRLTGSGRPHGLWRPAVLRTWALEGQLPTYGQMSGSSGFYGGAMAYLMGSAYLEWLVEREGGDEAVLPNVWRRATARQKRSFDGAFTGVFGAPPSELYGHFAVDVTERALGVRDAVEAAGGVVDGELFQRLSWYVGDPAVSPDGDHLAIQLTSRTGPSRLVVMATTPDTLPTEARERYDEVFEKDPEDVEPVQRRPRAQRTKATLYPALGLAYTAPAWMPDGEGVLVVRHDVEDNGRLRPDLFLWRWEDGHVRRVTRGAAVREAAPAPDGTWAAGVRCLHAKCDIVRIELDDGAVTPLTRTDPLRPYYHPRVSPDGAWIVAGVQVGGEWGLVAMDADGSNERPLGPDDGAARFDAEFLADGRLVLTSTHGGIHDIEILDPVTGALSPVTRVIGSAVAPTAGGDDGDLFFLSLHSRGWDLRRIARETPSAEPRVDVDPGLFPAATIPLSTVDTFPAAPLGEIRPYGPGPRFRAVLPTIHLGEDGYGGGLTLVSIDPIGRLSWQLQGMYGSDESPAGASLRARYRGMGPGLHVEGFWTRDPFALDFRRPPLPPGEVVPLPTSSVVPGGFYGGFGAVDIERHRLRLDYDARAGGSMARLRDVDMTRSLGFAEARVEARQGPGHWRFIESIDFHVATGRTGSLGWTRWHGAGSLVFRARDRGVRVSGTLGRLDAEARLDDPTSSIEAFTIGGAAPPLHDAAVLSQRIAMPALASGTLRGNEVRTWMAEASGILPVTLFYWAGDITGDSRGRLDLAGARLEMDTPPVPFLRLPVVRVRTGLAHLLADPDKGDWRGWLMLDFTP